MKANQLYKDAIYRGYEGSAKDFFAMINQMATEKSEFINHKPSNILFPEGSRFFNDTGNLGKQDAQEEEVQTEEANTSSADVRVDESETRLRSERGGKYERQEQMAPPIQRGGALKDIKSEDYEIFGIKISKKTAAGIGIFVVLFIVALGIYLWKKKSAAAKVGENGAASNSELKTVSAVQDGTPQV